MSPLSLVGIVTIILGIVQITFPDFLLKIRRSGISRNGIIYGGYMGITVGLLIVIFDIFII